MAALERNLLLISLLLAFAIASPDFYYLQTGGFSTGLEVGALSYLKVLKDLFYALIFIMLLIRHPVQAALTFFGATLIIIAPTLYTLFSTDFVKILFGFRWYFPIIIATVIFYCAPRQDFSRLGTGCLLTVMSINVSAQLIQKFLFPPLFFVGDDEILTRAPGLFFLPSASSILMTACFLYISRAHEEGKTTVFSRNIALLLLGTTIALSDSATALIVFLVLVGCEFRLIRINFAGILLATALALTGLYLAVLLSPRGEDIVNMSLFNRLTLFQAGIEETGIFSKDFGGATSAGIMLGGEGYRSLESTFGAIFGNLGIVPGIVLLSILFFLLVDSAVKNRRSVRSFPALLLVLGALVSVNAFEFFPIGAMMFLLIRRV